MNLSGKKNVECRKYLFLLKFCLIFFELIVFFFKVLNFKLRKENRKL